MKASRVRQEVSMACAGRARGRGPRRRSTFRSHQDAGGVWSWETPRAHPGGSGAEEGSRLGTVPWDARRLRVRNKEDQGERLESPARAVEGNHKRAVSRKPAECCDSTERYHKATEGGESQAWTNTVNITDDLDRFWWIGGRTPVYRGLTREGGGEAEQVETSIL